LASASNVAIFDGDMKIVLFLCTGNYYRSRFAEELFNHRAGDVGTDWQAQSRGLAIERGKHNVGPLSHFTLHALEARRVVTRGAARFPLPCTVVDLEGADHVVALDEAEHRPLMRERFPEWEARIEYWGIGDVGFVAPDRALSLLEAQIEKLLKGLTLPARSTDSGRG
jgi:protein-tyrosine phosphatase